MVSPGTLKKPEEIDDINEVVLQSNASADWLTFDDGQDLQETPVEDLHGHEYNGDLDIDLALVVDKEEVYIKAVNRVTLKTMCFTSLILHADLNKAFGLTAPENSDEPAASARKRARP